MYEPPFDYLRYKLDEPLDEPRPCPLCDEPTSGWASKDERVVQCALPDLLRRGRRGVVAPRDRARRENPAQLAWQRGCDRGSWRQAVA